MRERGQHVQPTSWDSSTPCEEVIYQNEEIAYLAITVGSNKLKT
jgi:hypothetical protein